MPDFQRQNEPVPEGVYKLIFENIEEKPASTGTPQAGVRLRIIEPAQYEGKGVFHNWTLTEKSQWVIERDIEAIAGDKFFVNGRVKFDWPDLIGMTCMAVLTVEDNTKGKLINKVNRFMRVSDMETAEEVPF